MLKLAALTVAVAACTPMMYAPAAAPQPAQPAGEVQAAAPAEAAVEAAPDTRTAGQIFVDIVTSQGYACTQQPTAWECRAPSATWQLYISEVQSADGSSTIWFDSYLERAFATRCVSFTNAVADLHDQGNSFSTSCDDSTRLFRFNTAVPYAGGLDVMAWVRAHEANRHKAAFELRGIRALSHESARVVATLR